MDAYTIEPIGDAGQSDAEGLLHVALTAIQAVQMMLRERKTAVPIIQLGEVGSVCPEGMPAFFTGAPPRSNLTPDGTKLS